MLTTTVMTWIPSWWCGSKMLPLDCFQESDLRSRVHRGGRGRVLFSVGWSFSLLLIRDEFQLHRRRASTRRGGFQDDISRRRTRSRSNEADQLWWRFKFQLIRAVHATNLDEVNIKEIIINFRFKFICFIITTILRTSSLEMAKLLPLIVSLVLAL